MSPSIANDSEEVTREYDDMSLESEGEEGVGGDLTMSQTAAVPLPLIQLSFDNSRGGAWDDRELVNAYDSAMEEFHIHHPGPGSWLDKATAALAKGQPLPGVEDHGTAWYTASREDTIVEQPVAGPSEPPPAKRLRKEKRSNHNESKLSQSNPYSSQPAISSQISTANRRASPSFAPGSPPLQPAPTWSRTDGDADVDGKRYNHAEGYDPPNGVAEAYLPSTALNGEPQVNLGVQTTSEVSTEDALGYAMTAQYWAGYWMGVARTKSGSSSPAQPPGPQEAPEGMGSRPAGPVSNVFVTRQQFFRQSAGGLRR